MSASTLPENRSNPDPTSAAQIAAYNKRMFKGDHGSMPNKPSTGVNAAAGASKSAILAYNANLGPNLWRPEPTTDAHRASNLASSASRNALKSMTTGPTESEVEVAALASKAASSALTYTGGEYVERVHPKYEQSKQSLSIAQMGAQRSQTMAREEAIELQKRLSIQQERDSSLPMDISKVLSVAQKNADARVAAAKNHLPDNFGVPTEEEKAERRQQVLSLITIADRNVKAKLSEINKDSRSEAQLFGSLEFQKIAMDIAARSLPDRLENHGKVNLGGGLYMTSDDIDDIARRHVQPVLEKVQQVADKKRIADRESAERSALEKKTKDQLKVQEKERKAEEKRIAQAEKAIRKQTNSWMKQKSQWESKKEQHPEGSRLWLHQRVAHLKEEIKEAKRMREDKEDYAERMHRLAESTKAESEEAAKEHHTLKEDYFNRGDVIDSKKAELGEDDEEAETVSLFELTQQRQTVKENVKFAKQKREELETLSARYAEQAEEAKVEAEESKKQYHDLKVEYFDVSSKADEAQKQFEKEEAERLERERIEREEAEKAAAEKAEADRVEAERLAAEKAEADKQANAERAEKDKQAAAAAIAKATAAGGAATAGTAAVAANEKNADEKEKGKFKSFFSKFKHEKGAKPAANASEASSVPATSDATAAANAATAAPVEKTVERQETSNSFDNYKDPINDNDNEPLRLPEASPEHYASDVEDAKDPKPSAIANQTEAMVRSITFKPEQSNSALKKSTSDDKFGNFDSSNVKEPTSMFKEDFN